MTRQARRGAPAGMAGTGLRSLPVPARLRPKTSIAPSAIVVGDPGRSLLLAQELLDEPKMSNHARGLWGYSGRTARGEDLTIQATGMGGPSAAIVLSDLAKLGVRRAIRIGTCRGLEDAQPGQLLLVGEAVAEGGSAASLGVAQGEAVHPDAGLLARLQGELPDTSPARIASADVVPSNAAPTGAGIVAADMQTVAVLAASARAGISAAAVLIVCETASAEALDEGDLEEAAKRAGHASAKALSPST